MNMRRVLLTVVAALLSLQVNAQALACVDDSLLDELLAFGDLFLGEIHGTEESPQLVQCLVDRALMHDDEKIIVSVELSELARNPRSPLWKQDASAEDGRTSQAMYALVMDLVEKERANQIELHFQHGGMMRGSAEAIGHELRALSERGLLIALAGNAHNMKRVPPGSSSSILQEGQHVGPNLTHISITGAAGGSFWGCTQSCGVHQLGTRVETPGQLVDGAHTGHDYILYLERLTASPPMNVSSP